jgi:isocitrate dehydrogenase
MANPSSLLLSAAMMLDYMGWTEAAKLVTQAIATAIQDKAVTGEMARFMENPTVLRCSEFGVRLIHNINKKF